MGVVFRSATSGTFASTVSPVVTAPTGLADGDVILIMFGVNDNDIGTGGSPNLNGFTDLGIVQNGTQGAGHALRKIASGEGASWTFTDLWALGSAGAYGCVVYHDDAAGDASVDQVASNAPASSTTPVSASITPSVDNCMIVGMFGGDHPTGVTATTLGGATERVDTSPNNGEGHVYIEELLQTTAAAVTMSATFSSAVLTSIFNISVKPVAAAGANPKGPLNNPFDGPFGGPV